MLCLMSIIMKSETERRMTMDIREKLVELLDDMQRSGTGYFGNAIENKKIADYLIAHGVTV